MADKKKTSLHIVFLLALLAFASSFHFVSFDNEKTRFDLSFSLALHGETNIDSYHKNTIDKAFYKGHYYCDKAPGLSFAAVPFILLGKFLSPNLSWSPDNPIARYILIFIVISVPSALSVYALSHIADALSPGKNNLPLLFCYLGSIVFPFSTMFYDHQFSSVLFLFSVFLFFKRFYNNDRSFIPLSFFGAFLASYSSISEYPMFIPSSALLLMWIFKEKKLFYRFILITGFCFPLILFMYYNKISFGSPFSIGYFFESHPWFHNEMNKGIGGVTHPNIAVLFNLLFSPHRGLFWAQPFLLLAIPGVFLSLRTKNNYKLFLIFASLFIAYRLLVNSSYYEPYGGFTPGPRFLTPTIPFITIFAILFFSTMKSYLKMFFAGFGVFSLIYFTTVNFVEPNVPYIFASPLLQYTIPLLSKGYSPISPHVFDALKIFTIFLLLIFSFHSVLNLEKNIFKRSHFFVAGLILISSLFFLTLHIIPTKKSVASYYLGTAFSQNRQYVQAIKEFDDSIKAAPDAHFSWYQMGLSYFRLSKYDDAISCFRKSHLLAPDNAQYLKTYFALLVDQEKCADASDLYERYSSKLKFLENSFLDKCQK